MTEKSLPDFRIETLGNCPVNSPLGLASAPGEGRPVFVPEDRFIYYNIERDIRKKTGSSASKGKKSNSSSRWRVLASKSILAHRMSMLVL